MTTTPTLGLTTYDTASGSVTTFLTFRLALAGNSSNMSILDSFAANATGSIVSLQNNMIIGVHASMITPNVYEATTAGINAYLTDSMIALELNVANTAATTLNINSLGAVTLKKLNYLGALVDIESGDLKANRWALFFYNGTYYVLMGTTTADQVSVYGNENTLLSISASGTIQASSVSASSVFTAIAGSSIMSGTTGSIVIHNINGAGVTTGSYNKVIVDIYGHITSASIVALAANTTSTVNNAFSAYNSTTGSFTKATVVSAITGSSVMSDTTGSIIKHNASGITTGSYNAIDVDRFGHITGGSVIATGGLSAITGSSVMSDTTGSIIKHNASGITTGSYNAIDVDRFGHITGGSVLATGGLSDITGSSVMSDTTGSTIRHNPSSITTGSYSKVIVDRFGHVTSGCATSGDTPFITTTKTGNYTLTLSDYVCFGSGSIIFTLPTAVANLGKSYILKNISGSGSGSIVIINSTAGSIESGSQISLPDDFGRVQLISDNTNWWKI